MKVKRQYLLSIAPVTLLAVILSTMAASAQAAENKQYKPIPLQTGKEIKDTLSDHDIPLGEEGGFGRDYVASFREGELAVIELSSDSFDTIVTLLGEDGAKVAENDDGPDGNTNSLLFWRFKKSGKYVIRVHTFGQTAGGSFTLKVTRLRPAE